MVAVMNEKWFENLSIRKKIFCYLLIVILLPFILLGFLQSRISTREIERIMTQNTEKILNQVDMVMGFYIREIENSITILESHPEVEQFLCGEETEETESTIRDFLRVFRERYPEMAGILIVRGDDHYISNEIHRVSKDSLLEERWYQGAARNPYAFYTESKPIGRNLASNINYSGDEILSVVKAVVDPKTGRCLGVILIDFKLSTLDDHIRSVNTDQEGFLYVMDSNGEIVYAPYNPVVYRIDNQYLIRSGKEKSTASINGSFYQILCKDCTNSDWTVVGVFPLSAVTSVVNMLRYVTAAIFVCTMILALIFSRRCNRTIIEPLSKLQRLMETAEDGNLDVCFHVRYHDEIGKLGNSFNRLLAEIKRLLHIVEQENKLKREAEFQVLQEQIKPHFLYNTLGTINWMAIEYGASEIVEVVTALTNLFRISLSKGKEYIPVSSEIQHVRNYLIIQKVRYEDKFRYEINLEEELSGYMVLKLILQPLVENSIYHGIKESEKSGKISVIAKKEEEKLVFLVQDDGVGMTQAKVQQINAMFASGEKTVGYGLFNINQRLKYTFGEEYGLRIESEPGKGTTVFVYHPLMEEDAYENIDRR